MIQTKTLFLEDDNNYDDDDEDKLTKEERAKLIEWQVSFFHGDFKKYLRESAEDDSNFLVKFVECVTGSNYLPHDDSYQIRLQFSYAKTGGLPTFNTCSRGIIIHGREFIFGGYKNFKKVMNEVINVAYNQFTME